MSTIRKYTEINTTEEEKKEQSSIIALETLVKEYDVVLTKYIQAQSDYITTLNSENKPSQRKFLTNQGTAFWGEYGISENSADNVNSCVASCSLNPKCSGATFNSAEQYCRLRGGVGDLVAASKNEISIIPESTNQLDLLRKLNEKLIQINNQITQMISANMPLYTQNKQEMDMKNNALKKNYYKLTADKMKIEEQIKENEDLHRQKENNALILNSNYSKYMIYFICVIVLLLFISTMSIFSGANNTFETSTIPTESIMSSPFENLFTIFGLVFVFILIVYFYNKVM